MTEGELPPVADPVAAIARLTAVIWAHVDVTDQSQFAAVTDSLYELATLYAPARTLGPSVRSAIRRGMCDATSVHTTRSDSGKRATEVIERAVRMQHISTAEHPDELEAYIAGVAGGGARDAVIELRRRGLLR